MTDCLSHVYSAVQAGLLTPLTFARHSLSPLAVLLPVRTFFTNEGGDSEFANFTLPTLEAYLEACSQNVSGNKQQLIARAIGRPKTHFFPPRTRDLLVSQKTTQGHFFSSFPPSIPFPRYFGNYNSGGICNASQF